MTLWIEWLQAVRSLRPACSRSHTFLWLVLVLMGLCWRADNAGVTSFVRVVNFRGEAYHRFLPSSTARASIWMRLLRWARLCLTLFRPFQVAARIAVPADGIKASKEGKRMPAVKLLHQQSASNSKPNTSWAIYFGRSRCWSTDQLVRWPPCR